MGYLAPGQTIFIGRGKERTRESTPEPENVGATGSRLVNIETGKPDEFDTTRQGLGNVLDEIGRCAAQNQKSSLIFRAVGQPTQYRKQLGHCLNFIDDHETSQGAEHELRILEAV